MADFELTCAVETEATSVTGERKSAWSEWDSVTAPEGYVINKDKVELIKISERGSENKYNQEWKDNFEIIKGTGIELPRTMQVQVFARSSKGNSAGGGSTKYKFSGDFTKLP